MNLTSIDYEILELINAHPSISANDILVKFPDNIYSTKYRIELLCKSKVYSNEISSLENTGYITENYIARDTELGITHDFLGTYIITNYGKKMLSAHNEVLSEKKKNDIIEQERIDREKKALNLAYKADKRAKIANIIAMIAIIISLISFFN